MRYKNLFVVFWLFSWSAVFADQGKQEQYFFFLSQLEFSKAKDIAGFEKDSLLQLEMLQLADILYYEGQINSSKFKITSCSNDRNLTLCVVTTLEQGYFNLFYDRIKGNAYKYFYKAYQLAKIDGNSTLIKACLLALLKYYNLELGQNSDYHLPYLKQLEKLQSNSTDCFWVVIYKMIFFTQLLSDQPEDAYFKLSPTLDKLEQSIDPESTLLPYLFYEKAIKFDVEKKYSHAIQYYLKAVSHSKEYPFLRNLRFHSALRLSLIQTNQKEFILAKYYLKMARKEIDKADTLRSNYSLDSYSAWLMAAQKKYDSAFFFLWRATREEFQLGFTTNSLEISRLNVELETQEKENANLQLKQDRTWLITALVAAVLVMAAGYFAYANQKSKTKMQLQEKEVQAMKLEKQLKEQEILGIDLMIEGQEKERQRIANDLHDDLGGHLAAVKIKLESMEKQLHLENEQNDLFKQTSALLNEAYQKVRSMAHARNAGINAQEGLLPAVRNFAAKVSVANRLSIAVEEHGMDTRLENSLEITIFRVIQELITNVIKHAYATEAIIHLTQHEDSINVMVEDNGVGFDRAKIKPGDTMGLYSIQKRIENLGGEVTIDSIVKKGTTVIIDIPLS